MNRTFAQAVISLADWLLIPLVLLSMRSGDRWKSIVYLFVIKTAKVVSLGYMKIVQRRLSFNLKNFKYQIFNFLMFFLQRCWEISITNFQKWY